MRNAPLNFVNLPLNAKKRIAAEYATKASTNR